jgi:hypothetical protein
VPRAFVKNPGGTESGPFTRDCSKSARWRPAIWRRETLKKGNVSFWWRKISFPGPHAMAFGDVGAISGRKGLAHTMKRFTLPGKKGINEEDPPSRSRPILTRKYALPVDFPAI